MNRIIYFGFLFLFISCQDETKILSFKGCKVEYKSNWSGSIELSEGHHISNKEELELANNELALCLCEKYLMKPDKEIKFKILEIYNNKTDYLIKPDPKSIAFDTILEYRSIYFDSSIAID